MKDYSVDIKIITTTVLNFHDLKEELSNMEEKEKIKEIIERHITKLNIF